LRQARGQRLHAIVLDLVMPELSGFEVLDRLREDAATAEIPVVVLTSKSLSREEHRALSPGAVRIFSKHVLGQRGGTDELVKALMAVEPPVPPR
jgi:CheY-like chemotaxis protein